MNETNLTIAFATDDGNTISQHFGRARYFLVLTVQDGRVVGRELREKTGHHTFGSHDAHDHHEQSPRGQGPDASAKHARILEPIADCSMLVAGGMGAGAFQHATMAGIEPVLTDGGSIDNVLREIVDGTILNHMERLH